MNVQDFKLEHFFARHEFTTRLTLSASDCEPLNMAELLELASPEDQARWAALSLGYTESAGDPELRRRVASLYNGISQDNVLYAAPEEAIFVAMHAMLSPGDRVVVIDPAYQSLHEIPRSIGCEVVPWPIVRDGATWTLDLELLDRLLSVPTALLVVNFPHNPTGYHPTRACFVDIVNRATAAGARVFCDEMYRGLEFGDKVSLPAVCEMDQRAVSLSGLSKTYALPGLRAGWLVSHDTEVLTKARALKDYTTICAPAPAEVLAMIALNHAETLSQRSRQIVRDNLHQAQTILSTTSACLLPPCAGSTCLLEVDDADKLSAQAIEQDGLLVVPSSLFDMPGSYVRLGLGRREFSEALVTFSKYL